MGAIHPKKGIAYSGGAGYFGAATFYRERANNMNKPIAFVSENPLLGDLLQKIDECHKRAEQQQEFLQKQAESIGKQFDEHITPLFKQITEQLKSQGKLAADFDDKDHHYHVDRDSGLLYICSRKSHNDHPLEELLKNLGGIAIPIRTPKKDD